MSIAKCKICSEFSSIGTKYIDHDIDCKYYSTDKNGLGMLPEDILILGGGGAADSTPKCYSGARDGGKSFAGPFGSGSGGSAPFLGCGHGGGSGGGSIYSPVPLKMRLYQRHQLVAEGRDNILNYISDFYALQGNFTDMDILENQVLQLHEMVQILISILPDDKLKLFIEKTGHTLRMEE